MKKFVSPEMEIIEFKVGDLIVASGGIAITGTGDNNGDGDI